MMNQKITSSVKNVICLVAVCMCFIGCGKSENINLPVDTTGTGGTTPSTRPVLTGKIVFHNYVEYGAAASLYIYDFKKNQLTFISKNWNIFDPMNAHFSPDGLKLVFMGQAVQDGKWNIYIWTVGSADMPVNLTSLDGCRDEDPNFSPDGTSICFKQTPPNGTGNLKMMDLTGTVTKTVTSSSSENGMPGFTPDGNALIYASGSGSSSDIFIINTDGSNNRSLAGTVNVDEYFPVSMSDSTFLYSRWYSSSNKNDQIYMGYYSKNKRLSLPFNSSVADYSDPCPFGAQLIFISSDKAGGSGAYDLYVANSSTGEIWSLSMYNAQINTSLNELGCSYFP